MILAGDVGGTKTNLAIFEPDDKEFRTAVAEESFPSRQYGSLERILEIFLEKHAVEVSQAAFGIAGPVAGGSVVTPNLPWHVTEASLAERIKTKRIRIVNDLFANACGIPSLGPGQFHELNVGIPAADGNSALISAGTGCGMTGLVRIDGRLIPIASEGGHIDFAPRNALEFGLLEYLRQRFGRVSYDRIVSGPGLHNIYMYLRDASPSDEPDWLAERIEAGDASAEIGKAALDGASELAERALDLLVSIYGAIAGNLALMYLATHSLYIGGGIAPKILKKLKDGTFLTSFTQKGRFAATMEKIPVRVILEPKTALYGAARLAASL